MTDKQDTHDRTRRRPPESFRGAHRGRIKARGRGTQQNTAGDAQQPRNTQRAGGSEDKRREARRRHTAAGREQGEIRQTEKKYVIYLRER